MKLPTSTLFAAIAASLSLTACGPTEAPKATPAATPASGAVAAAAAAAKAEDKPDVPDTHGMPGMSELFKADPKAEEKPAEKANIKPAEKVGEKK